MVAHDSTPATAGDADRRAAEPPMSGMLHLVVACSASSPLRLLSRPATAAQVEVPLTGATDQVNTIANDPGVWERL
jgi:hypothetical protein